MAQRLPRDDRRRRRGPVPAPDLRRGDAALRQRPAGHALRSRARRRLRSLRGLRIQGVPRGAGEGGRGARLEAPGGALVEQGSRRPRRRGAELRRQGPGVDPHQRRRLAVADRQVPLRRREGARDRAPPALEIGDLLFLVADEEASGRQGGWATPAAARRQARPHRSIALELPVGRRLPAVRVERGGQAVGSRAPPVHGAARRGSERSSRATPGACGPRPTTWC